MSDIEEQNSFVDLKGRLDEIVAAVSNEDIPLEKALDLYEEAVGLGLQASRIMEQGIAERDAQEAAAEADQATQDAAQSESVEGSEAAVETAEVAQPQADAADASVSAE